jgi:ribosome maturation factor RimP
MDSAQESAVTGSRAAGVDEELERLAARVVAEFGLELVELAIRGTSAGRVLRVDIDCAGAAGVGIEDCQNVSRAMGVALDEADLIPTDYVLEVSSPGIDRPIRTADDIRRNTGRRVLVVANGDSDRSVTHRGVLRGGDETHFTLETDDGTASRIPRERVVRAQQDLPF